MSHRYLRPGVLVGHVLVLVAALVCLRLGWWQWSVAHASRGTVQNLGYALLWPVFAGAFIFMWLRFLHLESTRETEATAGPAGRADADDRADGEGRSGDGRSGDGRAASGAGADRGVDDPVITGAGGAADDPGETGRGGTDSAAVTDSAGDGGAGKPDHDEPAPRHRRPRRRPNESYTIAVATVGDDDGDDEELAAYNRALAALAEQDRRRAR